MITRKDSDGRRERIGEKKKTKKRGEEENEDKEY